MIVYEYPLHENIRTWLRLERLFMRFSALLFREHAIDHHYAISTLFEIADLCASANPKLEVMNELRRQKGLLDIQQQTASDTDATTRQQTDATLQAIQRSFAALANATGKPGQNLLEDNLLKQIKGRVAIAGGTFEFDRALYHAWLHQSASQRQGELAQWFSSLQPLAEGIQLILALIRSTGQELQRVVAQAGYYEQSLPAARGYQLLCLHMPDDTRLAAEIKGSKLGFNVSIMQRNADGSIQVCPHHIACDLALCY